MENFNPHTVNIRNPDNSGIWMVNLCLEVEWSGFQMVKISLDRFIQKKYISLSIKRYSLVENLSSGLVTGKWPFEYRTVWFWDVTCIINFTRTIPPNQLISFQLIPPPCTVYLAAFSICFNLSCYLMFSGLLIGGKIEHQCSADRSVGYYLEPLMCLGAFCKNPLQVKFIL
jgi:hypothetical protein